MLVPLDNFISRGTDTFLSNPDYLNMVLAMFKRVSGLTCAASVMHRCA